MVKSFLVTEPALLWVLVGATYLLVGAQIYRRLAGMPSALSFAIALVLVVSASTFKLAFTHEDAPELVVESLGRVNTALQGLSLVTRARITFVGLGGTAVYAIYRVFRKTDNAGQAGKIS